MQIQLKSWKVKHILIRRLLPIFLRFLGQLPHQSPPSKFGPWVFIHYLAWIPTVAVEDDGKAKYNK